MKAGDYILEANGRVINGAPAREMSKQLKDVQVGERLRLKLKRGDVLLDVIIVAGPQKA
jgi:predicted metalloprotease with PDZ domain